MQTNRDFYLITTNTLGGKFIRNYDSRCAELACSDCRHGAHNRDPRKYPCTLTCTTSWLAALHDQPLDIRIPWTPQPPEVEPNPL